MFAIVRCDIDLMKTFSLRIAVLPLIIATLLAFRPSVASAATVTVTKNEILYSLNKPEDFVLALVVFRDHEPPQIVYLRQPFRREPDFGVTSVNYDFGELLTRADVPA